MHRLTRSRTRSTRRLLTALAALALVGGGAASAGATPAPGPATATTAATTAGPKIIGGTPSARGAWPAQVALLQSSVADPYDAQFCGGTLVSARWVLTAAHCVVGVRPAQIDVAVGVPRLDDIGPRDRVSVTRIVIHPGALEPVGTGWIRGDAALLRLGRALPGPYAQLAGPAQDGRWGPGDRATVTGWGTTSPDGFVRAERLQQVEQRVITDARCARSYPGLDGPTSLCAALPVDGRGPCFGDSGGPLWVMVGSTWRQVGVVSGGEVCAMADVPAVYADVRGLHAWISGQVG